MDKNSLIGMSLVLAIFLGWSLWTAPSEEEKARLAKQQDSIAQVQMVREKAIAEGTFTDPASVSTTAPVSDSLRQVQNQNAFGAFAAAASGVEKEIVLENKLLKVVLSNKGGQPLSVQLKEFQRHDSSTLVIFDGAQNELGLNFFTNSKPIETSKLFFTLEEAGTSFDATTTEQKLRFRLKASDSQYIEYEYSLAPDSYMLTYKINFVGVDNIVTRNKGVELKWELLANSLERGDKWEKDNCDLNFKAQNEDVDGLGPAQGDDEEKIAIKTRWIAYKQQFFSAILIADNSADSAVVSYKRTEESNSEHTIAYKSNLALTVDAGDNVTIPFHFYFGPNKFSILRNIEVNKDENLAVEQIIPYFGWGIGLVNRYAIIPLFTFLSNMNLGMGIVILLMTLIIKGVLFPFTYKSYVSMAEMRALKPQIDKITEKIPEDKAMERQQATMGLYKKAGVSPMGGCLPMLLQFPILIAMFRFFPASIELRQESFLWAQDLSTYDVLFNLPFTIPYFGAHISGFTVLMTFSSILTMKFSNTQMSTSNQMPGMQTMMYMMPLMFMVWFNSYSSGLSYYYFLSNIITFGQTMMIRRFTDESKILARLEENKKKPQKQSKFQSRLQDLAKKQQAQQQNKRKK